MPQEETAPDREALGRASWTFLHSMASAYPPSPSPAVQTEMCSFLKSFANFYPCSDCAQEMQQDLQKHPPSTSSRTALSQWMCKYHNKVNKRLFLSLISLLLVPFNLFSIFKVE